MKIACPKIFKVIAIALCPFFIFEQSGFAQVAGQLDISGHLAALRNAFAPDVFRPLHLRYLSYNPQENNFQLFLDKGSLKNPNAQELEDTTKVLLNYFFVGISLPNDKFWVNLRPDAEDNIIDNQLAQTDVGKILLESDLQLKKDTARFTSPETPEGKVYWDKLYQKAGEIFGSQNITIPTLTRPWIVPDEIIIRETTDSAYIYKATLKVMLEQDYLKDSAVYNFRDDRLKELNEYSSQLIRELIIPKLNKEVNSAKRYASLRQVYYSLILASWFKARNQDKTTSYSRLIDRGDLTNLTSKEPWSKDTYFKGYKENFEKGEYNLQEPVYTLYGQTIRSYFSGGISGIAPFISSFGAVNSIDPKTGARITSLPANTGISKIITKGRNLLGILLVLAGIGINSADPTEARVTVLDNPPTEIATLYNKEQIKNPEISSQVTVDKKTEISRLLDILAKSESYDDIRKTLDELGRVCSSEAERESFLKQIITETILKETENPDERLKLCWRLNRFIIILEQQESKDEEKRLERPILFENKSLKELVSLLRFMAYQSPNNLLVDTYLHLGISFRDILLIYNNPSFASLTASHDLSIKFSIARSIELTLKRFSLPVNNENTEKVLPFILKIRERYADRIIVSANTPLLFVANNDPKFDNTKALEFFGKLKLDSFVSFIGADTEDKDREIKKKISQAIGKALPNTTIWFTGHGGRHHFWITRGELAEEDSMDFENPFGISYKELVEMLLLRAKLHEGKLSDLTIIADACLSADFVVNTLNYLTEAFNKNEIKDFPVFITAANRRTPAQGISGGIFYGNRLTTPILYSLVTYNSKDEIPLRDIYNSYFGRDFDFFLPVSTEEFNLLKKQLGIEDKLRDGQVPEMPSHPRISYYSKYVKYDKSDPNGLKNAFSGLGGYINPFLPIVDGQMKSLGQRGPWDKDVESDFSGRRFEFETQAALIQPTEAYGIPARVIQADLGNVGAYHFYSPQYGPVIVVNLKTSREIQEEGKFHEIRETYWQMRQMRGFNQHEAHVIASAEQVQRFATKNNPTVYHEFQLERMTEEDLEAIINEDELSRQGHHAILERANSMSADIDIGAVKGYEQLLRQVAAEEMVKKRIQTSKEAVEKARATPWGTLESLEVATKSLLLAKESLPTNKFTGFRDTLDNLVIDYMKKFDKQVAENILYFAEALRSRLLDYYNKEAYTAQEVMRTVPLDRAHSVFIMGNNKKYLRVVGRQTFVIGIHKIEVMESDLAGGFFLSPDGKEIYIDPSIVEDFSKYFQHIYESLEEMFFVKLTEALAKQEGLNYIEATEAGEICRDLYRESKKHGSSTADTQDFEDYATEGNVAREDVEAIAELADLSGAKRITLPADIIQELETKFGPGKVGPVEVVVVAQPFMHTRDHRLINGPVRLGSRIFVGNGYFANHNNDLRSILAELGHEAMAQWVAERRPDLTADDAHELARDMQNIFRVEKESVVSSAKRTESTLDTRAPVDSPSTPQLRPRTTGGIDFRSLPIVTQAIGNLKAGISGSSISTFNNINLSQEWQEIQKMLEAGITPSSERIKDYIRAACVKNELETEIDKIISCIADILRSEEEQCCETESTLRDLLVVLESATSSQQLKEVFIGNAS